MRKLQTIVETSVKDERAWEEKGPMLEAVLQKHIALVKLEEPNEENEREPVSIGSGSDS